MISTEEQTLELVCKLEKKVTTHRLEGCIVRKTQNYDALYEKFKNKLLYTCQNCHGTFCYTKGNEPYEVEK